MTIAPAIQAFFDEPTNTVTYVVSDPTTRRAAVIDPVLDYDHRTGKASAKSADAILGVAAANNLTIEWVLETHAHADHLSGAPYVKLKAGAKVGIGEHIREVQKIFRPVFNATDVTGDGSEFDHLFKDGERFQLGSLEIEVLHVPGHTPADIAYKVGDAVFVGDTLFMPDYGTARADFPGGNARTLYRSIKKLLALPTRACSCAMTTRRRVAITTLGKPRLASSASATPTSRTASTRAPLSPCARHVTQSSPPRSSSSRRFRSISEPASYRPQSPTASTISRFP